MEIIGIAGPAGSGKTTFGGMLAAHLVNGGYVVHLDAFAVGVKREAREVVGWKMVKDGFWRRVLQEVGHAARKHRGENHWIHGMALRAEHAAKCGDNFMIVTDVRYPNELAWVRQPICAVPTGTLGGHAIGGGVSVLMTMRGADLGANADHPSETALRSARPESWDVVVHNAGDLRLLDEQAYLLAEALMHGTCGGDEALSAGQCLLTLSDDARHAERFDIEKRTEGWDSRVRPGVPPCVTVRPIALPISPRTVDPA